MSARPCRHRGEGQADRCIRFIEIRASRTLSLPGGDRRTENGTPMLEGMGYRSQVVIERGQVRVFSRNGHDWSDRYPGIVRAAAKLPCKSAIIDGEAIVQDGDGRSDY